MVRVAVTGHMDITQDSVPLIREKIAAVLDQQSRPVVGVSCIARGADSVFAEAVLNQGGVLEVVLPSRNYREAKVKEWERSRFDHLVAAASAVHVMPFETAGRAAYEAANSALLGNIDLLIAIWDGNTSKPGGTGTVVAEAHAAGIPVTVLWPEGAQRAA